MSGKKSSYHHSQFRGNFGNLSVILNEVQHLARHGKAKWITNMSEIVNLALAAALPQWVNDLFAYSN